MWSDGIAPPAVYLEPSAPNDAYGSPMYANSHLGFFRGINRQDINTYDSVELWASPYSDDPAKLQPTKLATTGAQSIPIGRTGGWGFAAFPTLTTPDDSSREFAIWNLAAGTSKIRKLPDTYGQTIFSA